MQDNLSLIEMMQNLLQVEDETFGLYAFSRDILKERISAEKKLEMIRKAISCGKKYAQLMIEKYETCDVNVIAEKLKLKIELEDALMTGKRILFASYTPPAEIRIMTEPVNKAAELISEGKTELIEYFQKDSIMNIIIGHELFHHLEDQFEEEIYTRTEKILLWKFLGFKNCSTVRALGEIGAMAFTKELNRLKYCPFVLDILLYYSYDSLSAEKIYHDVLEMS